MPYILRSSQRHSGDVGNPLQAKAEQSLTGLALRTRLDFVKSGRGSGVLLLVMLMVVVIMVVIGVVGCYFFNVRHLQEKAESANVSTMHPSKARATESSQQGIAVGREFWNAHL